MIKLECKTQHTTQRCSAITGSLLPSGSICTASASNWKPFCETATYRAHSFRTGAGYYKMIIHQPLSSWPIWLTYAIKGESWDVWLNNFLFYGCMAHHFVTFAQNLLQHQTGSFYFAGVALSKTGVSNSYYHKFLYSKKEKCFKRRINSSVN